ncbi:hypothetical protein [Rufibacter sp. LB8]|uniref:hypothetical protein n=1 Tax=Rufibacter sp. LB8 TaxID=2777781 RepID=UPI00178C4012|nr:hypothetical protein [Rufibacter sp. LB8]
MKPKINFSTHAQQDDQRAYWQTKSYSERLAEAFRLNRKVYHAYYAQANPQPIKVTRIFVKEEHETLEEFFARKNAQAAK